MSSRSVQSCSCTIATLNKAEHAECSHHLALLHCKRDHAGVQAMDLIAVGQGSGDVAIEDYEAALAAGPITPPAMAGLGELLHALKLDDLDHNPFVSEAPVRAAFDCAGAAEPKCVLLLSVALLFEGHAQCCVHIARHGAASAGAGCQLRKPSQCQP